MSTEENTSAFSPPEDVAEAVDDKEVDLELETEQPDEKKDSKKNDRKKSEAPFNPLEDKKEDEVSDDVASDKSSDSPSSDLQKRFKETQNSLFSHQRQKKAVLKKMAEIIDEHGSIDEESANSLMEMYDAQDVVEMSEELEERKQNKEFYLLKDVISEVKKELPTYKKYNSEDNLDKHLYSFERFYAHDANQADKEFIVKELFEKHKGDTPSLLKNMAKAGKNIYDSIYKPYEEAGGIYGLVESYNKTKQENEALKEKLKEAGKGEAKEKRRYNLNSGYSYDKDLVMGDESQTIFADPSLRK